MSNPRKMALTTLAIALLATPAAVRADSAALDSMNDALAASGANYRAYMAEIKVTADGADRATTIFAKDVGNKQLGHHWVPGDARRGGFTDILWLNDLVDGATTNGRTTGETSAAIRSAMTTWQNVSCSTIPLTDGGDILVDLGFVQNIFGFGGIAAVFADVTHAGWLPGAFFVAFAGPGADNSILGVTFTFIFVDGGAAPTDIDGNGKLDTAFREIYYNDNFPWFVDGTTNFDIESVALHEAGHGLSQGHFGKIFLDNKGNLKTSPKAVMNAGYTGPDSDLGGSDNGGHCSIWAHWPNN